MLRLRLIQLAVLLIFLIATVMYSYQRVIGEMEENAAWEVSLIQFNDEYNKFIREWVGCPLDAHTIEECNRTLGKFNYKQWKKVYKLGHKIFKEGDDEKN